MLAGSFFFFFYIVEKDINNTDTGIFRDLFFELLYNIKIEIENLCTIE